MSEPRHGQWVRFRTQSEEIPMGAHITVDGFMVGIYQRGRFLQDGAGGEIYVPAHVVAVRPDGENLMRLADDSNSVVKVTFSPTDCLVLEPARLPADLPRCTRTNHLFSGE